MFECDQQSVTDINQMFRRLKSKPTGLVHLRLRLPREIERQLRASERGMRQEIIALLQQRYCYNG